jgi:hypothetical protein
MTNPTVSIVYITNRSTPRFDWFADSLARQLGDEPVEVIVVDGHHSSARTCELARMVDDRFEMRHVPPKPTPYSGPQRLTRNAYSTIASARNTGLVYASAPYVVFSDDSSVLMDGWLAEVSMAARHGYVLAGTYENRADLRVVDGQMVSGERSGDACDSRWEIGDDDALVQIVGSQLFGCAHGAPRADLLAINGFDELCDPIGGEDTNLGVRLEWSGRRLFFSRRMMAVKDGLRHAGDAYTRLDRGRSGAGSPGPARYMECLSEFGVSQRTLADGPWDCSHLCLDLLYGTRSVRALGNHFDLAALTEADLAHLGDSFPERYWATGELLAEL